MQNETRCGNLKCCRLHLYDDNLKLYLHLHIITFRFKYLLYIFLKYNKDLEYYNSLLSARFRDVLCGMGDHTQKIFTKWARNNKLLISEIQPNYFVPNEYRTHNLHVYREKLPLYLYDISYQLSIYCKLKH